MKSYTDIEQSKKLAEILPIESADMYYINGDFGKISIEGWENNVHDEDDIPCWSLAALLSVLPNYQLQTQDDGIGILCSCNGEFNIITADNPINACYEMIIKLKEINSL